MCIICRGESIEEVKEFNYDNECPKRTNILFSLTRLEILSCYMCRSLKVIPSTLGGLKELYIDKCNNLTSISSDLVNLRVLNCSRCPLLNEIPATFSKLTELYIYNCPLIRYIPSTLTKLTKLDCARCPLLRNIPRTLIELRNIFIYDCSIINLPSTFVKLEQLNLSECRLLTRELWVRNKVLTVDQFGVNNNSLEVFYCSNCPFLDQNNEKFTSTLKKVVYLQTFLLATQVRNAVSNPSWLISSLINLCHLTS